MSKRLPFAIVGAGNKLFVAATAALLVLVLIGLWAAHAMEAQGHHITGMNNRIVWGMPHVFAIFLIVAAFLVGPDRKYRPGPSA